MRSGFKDFDNDKAGLDRAGLAVVAHFEETYTNPNLPSAEVFRYAAKEYFKGLLFEPERKEILPTD
jgi:hypothetical protein